MDDRGSPTSVDILGSVFEFFGESVVRGHYAEYLSGGGLATSVKSCFVSLALLSHSDGRLVNNDIIE